jgi:hypothetical protein
VSIPITGTRTVEVEADTEAEAIEAAWDVDWNDDQIDQLEQCSIVCEGNVFHGLQNEVDATKVRP